MSATGHIFPQLTFREKALVSLATATVIFTLGRQLVFEPLYRQYSNKQIQLEKLIDQKKQLTLRLKQINALQSKLSDKNERSYSLRKELATLKGSMMQSGQLKSVLDLLEEMARQADMSLLDMSVNLERTADDPPGKYSAYHKDAEPVLFSKNLIKLLVKTSYKSLTLFMQKLSTLPLAMSISRIDISSDPMAQNPGVTARLNLELYSSL